MAHGSIMAQPQGSHVLHRLIEGMHEQIFLSETIKPRALVDLYQVFSIYVPGAKNGTAPGVTCLTWAYIGKTMKKSSLLKQ